MGHKKLNDSSFVIVFSLVIIYGQLYKYINLLVSRLNVRIVTVNTPQYRRVDTARLKKKEKPNPPTVLGFIVAACLQERDR